MYINIQLWHVLHIVIVSCHALCMKITCTCHTLCKKMIHLPYRMHKELNSCVLHPSPSNGTGVLQGSHRLAITAHPTCFAGLSPSSLLKSHRKVGSSMILTGPSCLIWVRAAAAATRAVLPSLSNVCKVKTLIFLVQQ